MSRKAWLDKKPDTNRDMVLGALDSIAAGAGKVLAILSPFAGGVVLAYVLDPFVRWMTKTVLKNNAGLRWAAILCAYAVFLLLLVLLVWLVLPQVAASMVTLFTSLPGYIENVQNLLREIQNSWGIDLQGFVEMLDNYEQLMNNLYTMAVDASPQIVGYLQAVASNVVSVFTAVASSIYMLSGKDKLLRQLRTAVHAALPRGMAEGLLRICRTANENITGFYVGKVMDSAVVGVVLFIVMSILGIDFAPVIAVLMGVCNIIPIFGPFIGAVPSVIILLFVNPLQALEFVILVVVVQQVDSNVIAPKILGRSMGISAFWVLFAVLLGANLFGVVGMVMGVPVFATLYGLAGEAVRWLLDRRGIDEDGVRIVRPESAAEAAVHIRGDEDAPAPDQPAGPADRP